MNVSASFGDKLVCVSKEDYIRNSIRVFVNLVYSSFLNPKSLWKIKKSYIKLNFVLYYLIVEKENRVRFQLRKVVLPWITTRMTNAASTN